MLTTGFQLAAARAIVGMEQTILAERSGLSVTTIRNMEKAGAGPIAGRAANVQAVQRALEAAGIELLNSGQPGVRLRKAPPAIATQIEVLEEKIATIPEADEPSPEAAMNVMRKAVAENDLANLKGRQPRSKRK